MNVAEGGEGGGAPLAKASSIKPVPKDTPKDGAPPKEMEMTEEGKVIPKEEAPKEGGEKVAPPPAPLDAPPPPAPPAPTEGKAGEEVAPAPPVAMEEEKKAEGGGEAAASSTECVFSLSPSLLFLPLPAGSPSSHSLPTHTLPSHTLQVRLWAEEEEGGG